MFSVSHVYFFVGGTGGDLGETILQKVEVGGRPMHPIPQYFKK